MNCRTCDRMILVAAENVGSGVDDQQLRLELERRLPHLLEEWRQDAAAAAVETHQQIVVAEARQPADLIEIAEPAAVQPVDVLLPALQLVEIVLAQDRERADRAEPSRGRAMAG